MKSNNGNKTSRKRGAQPGNTNALKHGFYSRKFSALEHRDLETSLGDDLRSEAAMLRVVIRRVFELSADIEDREGAFNLLRHISLAVGRLAAILRVRSLYGLSPADEYQLAIDEALSELVEELDLSV